MILLFDIINDIPMKGNNSEAKKKLLLFQVLTKSPQSYQTVCAGITCKRILRINLVTIGKQSRDDSQESGRKVKTKITYNDIFSSFI